MTSLGLPVPHGFTITTDACGEFYRAGNRLPEGLWAQVLAALKRLEETTGAAFGDSSDPLLVSVRSGAAISMPGMMDTVLNLGINEGVADVIARYTGNPRFALDVYRRFIQMFGSVVLDVDGRLFQEAIDARERKAGVAGSADLAPDDLRETIADYKRIVQESTGTSIPDDTYVQLRQAIGAVFSSWNSRRAVAYRDLHGIQHDLGTAVSIVVMVYGNKDDRSGTGVLFTRDPSTGARSIYGEYLANAQGEDVVAGTKTPSHISRLADDMPDVYRELVDVVDVLERHYGDVQDVEFTVEQGRLYILQTRSAQRSARAAVKTAVDMAREGIISREEAMLRVEPERINQLLFPRFEDQARETARNEGRLLATGLGASPGAATGKVVFDPDTAAEMGGNGTSVILARTETSPDDVHGIAASAGTLTSRGGATSHAAVVARGMGKPCVTAVEDIEIHAEEGFLRCGDAVIMEGGDISIDGSSGEIFAGSIATSRPRVAEEKELVTLLEWTDAVRTLGVLANADTPQDAMTARDFGAEGIGLCRTEHMFFEPQSLSLVRKMIIAAHRSAQKPQDRGLKDEYLGALVQLQQIQVGDFEGIFRAMDGKPVGHPASRPTFARVLAAVRRPSCRGRPAEGHE